MFFLAGIRNNSVALGHLTRVLAALVYGNDLKMAMLVDHFKPVLDFDRLDSEQWTEEEFRMELFCVLCANIERNSIGGTLKDYLISLGVVRDALDYIQVNSKFLIGRDIFKNNAVQLQPNLLPCLKLWNRPVLMTSDNSEGTNP